MNIIHLYVKVKYESFFYQHVDGLFFVIKENAVTERELVESTMERWNFWKCLILVWCIVDHIQEKKRKEKEREALIQAQLLQEYLNQCINN